MDMGFEYTDDLVIKTSFLNMAAQEEPLPPWTSSPNSSSIWDNSTHFPTQQPTFHEEDLQVELFKGYPASLLAVAYSACLLFMLLGIPGNLITIIALFRCKKVRNATAVFIINLSVSDLMSCCFNLPLAASTFWRRSWSHGLLLCRLFPLLRYGLLAVSLFTVLAITINRYVMIGHPTMYPKLYRKQYLGLMVAATWVCGFGALVATWAGKWGRFGLDPKIGSCSILPDESGRSPKEFLFLVAFVIPCICIVVCYARIFYIVRKTAMKSRVTGRTTAESSSVSGATSRGSYYPGRGKGFRRYQMSTTTEDSAIGSSSTGPSYSTDKSSAFLDNGVSSEINPENVQIKMITFSSPSPNLLSPPNKHTNTHKDPSSSSEVDECTNEEEPTSRSCTPTSLCESSHPISTKRRSTKKNGRRDRIPSAVNTTLSHVASVFRRTSHLRYSPRRASQAPPLPGKMTAKDKKLLKMILVIFAAFVTCYLPITISKTYSNSVELRALNIAGYILIYLTTCINPIIYVVMSSEYRQAYKNLLMCRSPESQVNSASKP